MMREKRYARVRNTKFIVVFKGEDGLFGERQPTCVVDSLLGSSPGAERNALWAGFKVRVLSGHAGVLTSDFTPDRQHKLCTQCKFVHLL